MPELARMLASKNRGVRCKAGWAIARLGDDRGLLAVIAELKDTSPRPGVREGITSGDGVSDIEDQVGQDRFYAVQVLGDLGDRRAVPALIEALKDPAIGYRAAMALGDIGDPRAAGGLKEMLKSAGPDERRRLWSGYGLAAIGDPAGVPAIAEVLKSRKLFVSGQCGQGPGQVSRQAQALRR